MNSKNDLQERIRKEMTVEYKNVLERNFDLAKQFIRVSPEGKVTVLMKDKFSGKERILLYLIGKLYAKYAEYSPSEEVGNKELMQELSIPKGSLLPWLKELRDAGKIRSIRKGKHTYHTIPIDLAEKVLKHVDKKMREAHGRNRGD
jgi:DNA-binding transcriptional ArsR family regulator